MHVCKIVYTMLDKVLRKNIKKSGEIRKHKLNEMRALKMK